MGGASGEAEEPLAVGDASLPHGAFLSRGDLGAVEFKCRLGLIKLANVDEPSLVRHPSGRYGKEGLDDVAAVGRAQGVRTVLVNVPLPARARGNGVR